MKFFVSQKLTKLNDFIMESGECMFLLLSTPLLPAVDVAASDLRYVRVQNERELMLIPSDTRDPSNLN